MNRTTPTLLAILTIVATAELTACRPVDCAPSRELGRALGAEGLEAAGARVDQPTACLEAFDAAYQAALADTCTAELGFYRGMSAASERPPAACTDPNYVQAWLLGHTLAELRDQRAAIEARLQALAEGAPPARPEEHSELLQQQLRIERDLPEFETLARMEGLMPPAEAPRPAQGDH